MRGREYLAIDGMSKYIYASLCWIGTALKKLEGLKMAHPQQQEFLLEVIKIFSSDKPIKVLDLGSLEINGGIRRNLPKIWEYTGVDLAIGPNVDLVQEAQLLDLSSGKFDICMASELFEHTPYWREIFAQMSRLTKEGGVVIFTCAGVGRLEHGTTRSDNGFSSPFTVLKGDEYYANVALEDARNSVAIKYWFTSHGFFEETNTKDLYFAGLRANATAEMIEAFHGLLVRLQKRYPKKRYLLRYWTVRLLPFVFTDTVLRLSHLIKIKGLKRALLPVFIYSRIHIAKSRLIKSKKRD